MRPLEIVLALLVLLSFGVQVVPKPPALTAKRYLIPLAAAAAAFQLSVEGYRWQMVPAYGLAVAFVLVWLFDAIAIPGLRTRRVLRVAGAGLGVLVLIASILLPLAFPVFHLPRPTGRYGIGTATYHWVDRSRREIFSTDPATRRQLMVQVWYPATTAASAVHAPYVQDAPELSPSLARLLHLPPFTFDYWSLVRTHVVAHAAVAPQRNSYPVLIFVTGLNGFRQSNTFQVEQLVSHGYIVVGIDQPYAAAAVAFPGGRTIVGWTRDEMQPLINQSISPSPIAPVLNGEALPNGIIPYLSDDVSFVLDRLAALDTQDPNDLLTGRLDLKRVGIFGISLGAIVTGEAAHRDRRIKAALMMDAAMTADVVRAGLAQPCMWITRDASTMRLERKQSGGWSEKDIAQTLDTMRAVFDESGRERDYFVQMPGMFHINFTDAPSWSPLLSLLGLIGPFDARRGFEIVNAYSLAFFDRYLKGKVEPLLDGQAAGFSGVSLERR